jgi:regulator of RNase E activity RraA
MGLDEKTVERLSGITTATLTTVLLKKGLRNVWLRGAKAVARGARRGWLGPAFTLRFVPAREDLATPESWSSPISTRAAIEAMPPGCVAVVDAMGVTDAGIFGDILCQRMKVRGGRGPGHRWSHPRRCRRCSTGLPVWCAGRCGAAIGRGLTFVDWQEPIGCGGVAVFPEDAIVADDDGAVVIPRALDDEVVAAAVEQEKLEAWIIGEVQAGAAARPLSAERGDEGSLRGLPQSRTKA